MRDNAIDGQRQRATCNRRRWLWGALMGLTLAACRPFMPSGSLPATATPEPLDAIDLPEMVLVQAGAFVMGDPAGELDARHVHAVTLSHSFLMGRYPVTFAQFDRYCLAAGKGRPLDGGWGRGNRPVVHVDWNQAVAYCNWLSHQAGLEPCYSGKGKVTRCDWSSNGYRLPTEAEWEYAARGGPLHEGTRWAGSDDPDLVAWHAGNAGGQTHPVGTKQPNALGLQDLCGNVWEWCWDRYHQEAYAQSLGQDPKGPDHGRENAYLGGWERVRRGGAYIQRAEQGTVAYRSFDGQSYEASASGIRLVRNAD